VDSELILIVFQPDAALHVDGLVEDDPSINLFADLHLMIEDHQPSKHGLFVAITVTKPQGADNVETILSAYQQFP